MTTLILVVLIVLSLVAAGFNDRLMAKEIDKLKLRVWFIENPGESANGRQGPEGREW